jgi:hypothetical protein
MGKKEFNEDKFFARLDLRIMALVQLLNAYTVSNASMYIPNCEIKTLEEAYNTYNEDFAKSLEELDKKIKESKNEN